jgi:hypothetical protein
MNISENKKKFFWQCTVCAVRSEAKIWRRSEDNWNLGNFSKMTNMIVLLRLYRVKNTRKHLKKPMWILTKNFTRRTLHENRFSERISSTVQCVIRNTCAGQIIFDMEQARVLSLKRIYRRQLQKAIISD